MSSSSKCWECNANIMKGIICSLCKQKQDEEKKEIRGKDPLERFVVEQAIRIRDLEDDVDVLQRQITNIDIYLKELKSA